jgi:Dolichyl-phosphate-mannose-protein mannosyltransferase
MRKDALLAVCIGVVAIVVTAGSWGDTTRWHPDSLFYEAQLLEVRGVEARVALDRVLSGPLADGVSAAVGDPEWVEYNRDFYRRRWVVPALGAAVEPAFGTDSLQLVSLVGYALVGPLLFLLLRRRFGRVVSCAAALACIALPSLRFWSAQPLTDSVAVALEALGLLAAVLVLDRGPRWLPLWFGAVLALGFTRDATIVLVAAAACAAVAQRSRRGVELLVTGVAAALPAPLLFGAPLQRSLALVVGRFQVPDDTSWGFIVGEYPGALWRVATEDFELVTRSTPVTGVLFVVALVALFALRRDPDPFFTLARGAALGCLAMILLQPNPTGLRLELVFVPVLAVGLAVVLERAIEWLEGRRASGQSGVESSVGR